MFRFPGYCSWFRARSSQQLLSGVASTARIRVPLCLFFRSRYSRVRESCSLFLRVRALEAAAIHELRQLRLAVRGLSDSSRTLQAWNTSGNPVHDSVSSASEISLMGSRFFFLSHFLSTIRACSGHFTQFWWKWTCQHLNTPPKSNSLLKVDL